MNKRTFGALACLLAFLLEFGCGSRSCPPIPTSAPMPATRVSYNADVDLDVARLFGEPPAVGRVPESPTWAPDGWHVAYTRVAAGSEGETSRELWIHEMNTHRERPLVSGENLSVSEFDWCGPDRLTFIAEGDLFSVDIAGNLSRFTESDSIEHSAQSAPDCSRIAFVRDHNLYVIDVATRVERPITRGGTARRGFAEATWVYREEFETPAGFGWSPDSKRLWLYATEASAETLRSLPTSDGDRIQAYPMPGEPIPRVYIGLTELPESGEPSTSWLDLGDEDESYLPQATWHPDSRRLFVARLDRLQTILSLLSCDAATKGCKAVIEERDPRWVNLLGAPRFIGKGEEFLWLSERNGFSHIYRFGVDGTPRQQVTNGEWTVVSIDAVDEAGETVYFTANAKEPFSYGIYRISGPKNEMVAVSKAPGAHLPVFAPDGRHFLDTHSALDRPPRTDIYKISGEIAAVMARSDLVEYHPPRIANDLFPVETGDGQTFMALLTRPLVLDPKRRYPVLIYVYGGPKVQVVKNAFQPALQPWRNLMASRGVLVFSLDGRGSSGRGHEFETPIHRRLGELELQDQLTGVAYLKSLPFVDPNRVAIFGWSYGGTMVLNALLRADGVFKAGIAVAPVTDWRQYDSAYTERYMQRPSDNPDGYRATSILPLAYRLKQPLLLIHGLADANVHFSHSEALVKALIDSGKYFDVMFFPERRHAIAEVRARAHLFTRVSRFIEAQL